jgi:hypothetical protein
MTEADQRTLVAEFVGAYNRFDVEGMLAPLAADVRFENVSGGRVTASAAGRDEFRALAERAVALFSEREQRITGIEFRGGAAVVSVAYRGVLAADLPGGPTAGSVLELVGESEFEFVGGKIGRITDRS